jgi:predicted PP-loop superfamily ATPase
VVIDIDSQVFGYKAVEEHAQYIGLEVPAVYASSKVIGYFPDGFVELCPLSY